MKKGEEVAEALHGDAGDDKSSTQESGKHEKEEKPGRVAAELDGPGGKIFRAADDKASKEGEADVSPSGKPAKEGEVQVTAPPTLQLHGYSGVRKVNGVVVKDMEKDLNAFEEREKSGNQLKPDERQKKTQYKTVVDDVSKTKAQDYLIFAGHIGVSIDGGATIYGFTPFKPEGVTKEELVSALHAHTMTFPGQVLNDKPHFDLAQKCAAEKGWDTDVTTVSRTLTTAAHAETKKKLQDLAGMAAPGAHGFYYSFPLSDAKEGQYFVDAPGPDGKIVKGANQANCATFPGKIGIEIPEQSGNLRFFMRALRQQATGASNAPSH